jgi:ABC-2 type transport system permease protein
MQTIRQTGWMVARQLRNISRQPIWVVMMIIQPMIWLAIYGQLYKNVGAQGSGPSAGTYIQFLAPGIICMNAFFGGMWSGMGMITDLDRKVVDRFLAAPASRFAIVLSQVVRAGITAMIQTLILLLAGLALGVRVHGGVAGWLVVFVVAFLLASAFAGFSNGLALIFRRPESMIATANMVGLPLMFLSSIRVTVTLMPGWIQSVSRYNPVSWGVTAARNAVDAGGAWGATSEYLVFLLAAMAVTSLFATWCFRSYQRSI